MMKHTYLALCAVAFVMCACAPTPFSPADQTASIDQKVAALVDKMTLAEKVAELTQDAPPNERLGIPEMLFGECLHGVKENGATSFPQAIALGSTWDPALVQRVANGIAYEARKAGLTHCYTPVLDVIRDPRYGRYEESYSEDPLLTTHLGLAFINGLQGVGEARFDDEHMMATAKHFAGYSEPHRGINGAYVDVSERTMWEIFFPPFEAAVKEAKVGSIMPAHHDLNGVPAHMNLWLLRDVLRDQWGFEGVIVSDNNDIQRTFTMHRVASDKVQAATYGLQAGVDIDLVLGKHEQFYSYKLDIIEEAISRDPRVTQWLDESVSRVLKAKFELGLFEKPTTKRPVQSTKANQRLAKLAAAKSLVLLKNENKLLPLNPEKLKRVAVIGPNAHDDTEIERLHLLGGYSRMPPYFVSVYSGLKNTLPSSVAIDYVEGLSMGSDSREQFDAAVSAANKADVVIMVMGGNLTTAGEGKDRDSIDFPGAQLDLMAKIKSTGKPIVMIIMNGRPLDLRWPAQHADALFEAWYVGMEGGNAIAETLVGQHNPGGKLSASIPRHIGQIPSSYLVKPDFIGTGKGQYINGSDKSPLYPFGFGLSYTSFKYGAPRLDDTTIGVGGETKIDVDVTNTGDRAGDEIVQFYVTDDFASVGRYMKLLKGFERVSLQPGETKTVSFDVGFDELALYDVNLNKVVEPGSFTLRVGPSSVDSALQSVKLTVQ